jgi:hypothetical protein
MDAAVKIFPPVVDLLPMAQAKLEGVDRTDALVLGRYQLKPEDKVLFDVRLGQPESLSGRRYEPIPGVWCALRKDKAGPMLDVGLDVAHGRALMAAQRVNKRTSKEIVPDYYIRALLMGLLGEIGV